MLHWCWRNCLSAAKRGLLAQSMLGVAAVRDRLEARSAALVDLLTVILRFGIARLEDCTLACYVLGRILMMS